MRRIPAVVGAASAAVGLVVAHGALPSGAQELVPSVEVTGTAECLAPTGVAGWSITWTITNTTTGDASSTTTTTTTTLVDQEVTTPATIVGPLEPGTVVIVFPTITGVWSEPVPVVPGTPLSQGNSFVITSGPAPNSAVGDVTLIVPWDNEVSGEQTSTATVTLDGSCTVAGADQDGPGVADAVASRPSLTG